MGTVKSVMIISDIHIGDNSSTNWFQNDIHAPYLESALTWARDKQVNELVLLGDLVDFWTYPSTQKPPTFQKIKDKNENIFGENGFLPNTVDALEKVTYINGNHDMTVTAADIASISPKIGFSDSLIYGITTLGDRKKIYCTHGHIYSMLCAPDHANPPTTWNNLPLGYFLTRLAAVLCEEEIEKEGVKNSAYLKDNGNPLGYSVVQILINIIEHWQSGTQTISELIMDGLNSPLNPTKNFVLPDGVTPANPSLDFIKTQYANLLKGSAPKNASTTFPGNTGIDESFYGWLNRSELLSVTAGLLDTDAKSNMYMWELALDTILIGPLMVMGHTHIPKDYNKAIDTGSAETEGEGLKKILEKEIDINLPFNGAYSNSGFNCPSVVDMENPGNTKHPTFTMIEWDGDKTYTIYVYMVVKTPGTSEYKVAPDPKFPPVVIIV